MSPDPRPAGLLLAAGGGTRLGRPKALVDFHGEPLVVRGVRLLSTGGCGHVVVVVGAEATAVAAALTGRPAEVVRNAAWRLGMGSSLRVGLDALRRVDAPAAVVALVDQPLVAPTAVRHLIAAWRAGARAAVATYAGDARTPALFDAATWDAVAASAVGDRGARMLLRAGVEWVQPVPCDASASPRDIDTEADLRVLLAAPDPNPPDADARPAT